MRSMNLDKGMILEGIEFRKAVSLTAEFKLKTMIYTVYDYNIFYYLWNTE